MDTFTVIERLMYDDTRDRYNLYLPREDGKEIIRRAKHAAVDARMRVNAWIFWALRQQLGMPEPTATDPPKKRSKKK